MLPLIPFLTSLLSFCTSKFVLLSQVWFFCDLMGCPWYFPGKNTGMGCHFLVWGIFLTQEWNLRLLPHLLHCRQVLYWWATFSNMLLSEKLPFTFLQGRFPGNKFSQFCLTVFLLHLWGISSLDIELWLGSMSCLLFRVFRFSVYFVINKNIVKVKCQNSGYWYDKASFPWINVLKQREVLGGF